METTQQTAEGIIKEIQAGLIFKFESPTEPGKVWRISKSFKADSFLISHNKTKLARMISKKRAQQTIETHINKTL